MCELGFVVLEHRKVPQSHPDHFLAEVNLWLTYGLHDWSLKVFVIWICVRQIAGVYLRLKKLYSLAGNQELEAFCLQI